MAVTGLSTGTINCTAAGDSNAGTLIIDKIRAYSSTGGPGAKYIIKDKGLGVNFFTGVSEGSYGMVPAAYEGGRLVHGFVVMSCPEGYIEIDLR